MEFNKLVKAIQADLIDTYGVPVYCTRIPSSEHQTVIRIIEEQSNEVKVGFDITLEWRRFHLELAWANSDIPFGVIEKWHQALLSNKAVFSTFLKALEKKGSQQIFRVNGKQTHNPLQSPQEQWNIFELISDSGFVEVINYDQFMYENFKAQIILFWGLMLSFIGEVEPLYSEGVSEGSVFVAQSIRYERSPINRQACITAQGTSCKVCGISMEDMYGELGKGFIEVHHLTPLSENPGVRPINPSVDLVPICPNCHRMIHKRTPPFSIEELREHIGMRNKK